MSIRPCVFEGSGDFFRVQLRISALSSMRGSLPPTAGIATAASGRCAPSTLDGRDHRRFQHRSDRGGRDLRRPRRGRRLLPLPLRAAAGPRLPLGGQRRLRGGARQRRLAPRAGPEPALRGELLGDLHRPRPDRDRPRRDPQRSQGAADQDLRGADRRDGRPLRRLALRHPPQPRVARRRPARARRQGWPDRRRRRLRDRLDPLHRPHPRRDPLAPPPSPARPAAAPSSSPSTRPAWRSPSSSPPLPSPA